MSYGYRQNSQARPFAYGCTASPDCKQSKLQETQDREGLPDMNTENPANYQKSGQQHPDGPAVSPNPKNQKDALNFGWFSLPHAKNGSVPEEDRIKSPHEAGGAPNGNRSPEINQRPLSKDGHRPDSQQRATPQQGRKDTPNEGPWPESQRPIEQSEVDQVGIGQGYGQMCHNQPVYEDAMTVDWPMSILAAERMHQLQSTAKPLTQMTSMSRSEKQDVPATPLPPLHWQGYQSITRPTYASWHDNWHHNSDPNSRGRDTNNSNCVKEADESHETNTNKAISESLDNNVCFSNNGKCCARNYAADGNNNNWMIVDENVPSSRTQVRTLPPYGQSSETVPRFYNPSVVMKWEDTDDESNSQKEKQTFKPISLMKRIRSSFLQVCSILSCLKNQDDEVPTQGSRLVKYDRFDYDDKKSKRNTQERLSGRD